LYEDTIDGLETTLRTNMTRGSHLAHRIGIEIGEIFADEVTARADGCLHTDKAHSIVGAIERAMLQLLDTIGAKLKDVRRPTHGSTFGQCAFGAARRRDSFTDKPKA
jgi:hypothetical protein